MDSLSNRVLTYVVVFFVAGIGLPSVGMTQELGQVFIRVLDQGGEPISDLSANEFAVMEDGVECEIVSAELGTAPMKIALLVDNSDPINTANALTSLRAGMDAFLTTIPEQHEIALATIGQNIRWRVDFTTDRDELRESAGEVFVAGGGGPILLDGIKETWERRFEDDESFPIFVIVATDGTESSGNMNQNQYAGMVNELIANGVTIHIMILSNRGGSDVTNYAINLTENTGGIYEGFGAGTRLATALPELAERMSRHYLEVSQRYRVIYERPDPPGASLSIGVAREGVVAQPYIDRRIPQ